MVADDTDDTDDATEDGLAPDGCPVCGDMDNAVCAVCGRDDHSKETRE